MVLESVTLRMHLPTLFKLHTSGKSNENNAKLSQDPFLESTNAPFEVTRDHAGVSFSINASINLIIDMNKMKDGEMGKKKQRKFKAPGRCEGRCGCLVILRG